MLVILSANLSTVLANLYIITRTEPLCTTFGTLQLFLVLNCIFANFSTESGATLQRH